MLIHSSFSQGLMFALWVLHVAPSFSQPWVKMDAFVGCNEFSAHADDGWTLSTTYVSIMSSALMSSNVSHPFFV